MFPYSPPLTIESVVKEFEHDGNNHSGIFEGVERKAGHGGRWVVVRLLLVNRVVTHWCGLELESLELFDGWSIYLS